MIVNDEVEIQHAEETFFRLFDDVDRLKKGFARRDQRGAIELRPGVILNMRNLDPLGVDCDGEVDDLRQMRNVLPMHRRIDRQAKSEFPRPARNIVFFGDAAVIGGNAVGVVGNDILYRDLHMI